MKLAYIYEQLKEAQDLQELNEGLIRDWIDDFSSAIDRIKNHIKYKEYIDAVGETFFGGTKRAVGTVLLIVGLCIFGVMKLTDIEGKEAEKIKKYLVEQTHSETLQEADAALRKMPIGNRKKLLQKAIKDLNIPAMTFEETAQDFLKHKLGLPHKHVTTNTTAVTTVDMKGRIGTGVGVGTDTHHYKGFHDEDGLNPDDTDE